MPWYTYDYEAAKNAAGQTVQVIQEAFYTGAGIITQVAATNPSTRTAYMRVYNDDGTLRRQFLFAPGATRQNSSQSVPAGTVTPVQDPDNPASWSIVEVMETGLLV